MHVIIWRAIFKVWPADLRSPQDPFSESIKTTLFS